MLKSSTSLFRFVLYRLRFCIPCNVQKIAWLLQDTHPETRSNRPVPFDYGGFSPTTARHWLKSMAQKIRLSSVWLSSNRMMKGPVRTTLSSLRLSSNRMMKGPVRTTLSSLRLSSNKMMTGPVMTTLSSLKLSSKAMMTTSMMTD